MGWLSGYPYRKKVTISGSSGAGAYYQVKLSIGSSSGGDFHLEGHCTDFPNDIRFTDDDGTTLLDYWIEDPTQDPITVWVEVKDSLDNNVDIYCYYGKSGESSASDGEATFLFFDDFEGTALDLNKWTGSTDKVEVSDGLLHGTTSSEWYDIAHTEEANALNKVVESRVKVTSVRTKPAGPHDGTRFAFFSHEVDGDDVYQMHDGSSWHNTLNDNAINEDTWDVYTIIVFGDGSCKYINNLGEKLSTDFTSTKLQNTGTFEIHLEPGASYYDWVLVRKYASPEPSFSSAGSEETPFSCTDVSLLSDGNYWAVHGASSDILSATSSSLSVRELLSLCSEALKVSDASQSVLSLFVQSQDNLELSDSSLLGSLLLASAIDTLNIDDGCHLILSFTHNCLDTLHSLDSTSFPLPNVLNCLDNLGAQDTLSSLLTVLCQSKDSIGGADGESSQLSSLSVLFDKLSSIDSTLSNVTFKQTLLDSLFLHDNSTLLLTILVFASDILASHDFNAVRLEFSSSSLDILKSQDNTSTNVVIHLNSADILKGADFISANLQALLSALSTFQQSDLTSSYKTLTGIPIKIFKAQHKILVFRAE